MRRAFAGLLFAPGICYPNVYFDGRRTTPTTPKAYWTSAVGRKRNVRKGFLYDPAQPGCDLSRWPHVVQSTDHGGAQEHVLELATGVGADAGSARLYVKYDDVGADEMVASTRELLNAHAAVRTTEKSFGCMVGIGDHLVVRRVMGCPH
jgi:hypothetical protein